jgi:beta-xylosidase
MTNRSVRSFVAGLWAAIFFGESMMAANPIVENKGLCDPAVRIYNNRIYLYATHDFSPKNHTFVMKDWWIWSSSDLVEWVNEAIVRPEDTYHRDPSTECWATDGIGHNGKYYFYFSMGPENIGVVMSDTPTGPWKDPLGKPLVPKGLTPVAERDPAIFQQADGTAYLVFGCWDYYIARLGDDRISLAEPPRKISFDRVDGPYGPG